MRLEPDLHRRLKVEAEAHQSSLNRWIVRRLTGAPAVADDVTHQVIARVFADDLEGVVAFGSYVRGQMTSASDIDLLIVLRAERRIGRELYSEWDKRIAAHLDSRYSPQFSHLPSANPSSLWLEVALEGEVLLDQSARVRSSLHDIRRQIAEGKFIRRISHGHPYWVSQQEKK